MRRAALLVAGLVACGRIDFGAVRDAGSRDGSTSDGALGDGALGDGAPGDGASASDASTSAIVHVAGFVALGNMPTWTFTARGSAAGDYVVFRAGCYRSSSSTPTVSISDDDGYGFQAIGGGLFTTDSQDWQVAYGAFVPNTQPVTITMTWSGSNGGACDGDAINGDEFANVDPTNPVDAYEFRGGIGTCTASATITHANEALWLACDVAGDASAVGSGFTLGTDNGDGDWSEYRVTTDPGGTHETATMILSGGDSYQAALVTLRPLP